MSTAIHTIGHLPSGYILPSINILVKIFLFKIMQLYHIPPNPLIAMVTEENRV